MSREAQATPPPDLARPDLAAVAVERDFKNAGAERAEALRDGNAERATCAHLPEPSWASVTKERRAKRNYPLAVREARKASAAVNNS
jgi:hypothetical protein